MNAISFTPRFLFLVIAILLAAFSRIFPHPPNFTPIAAMALFGGACFNDKRVAFIVPLISMALSDFTLHFISGIGWHSTILYVYASFILITCIGIYLRRNMCVRNVILGSLISSIIFFLITNFGVWATEGFTGGFSGLVTIYVLGIPFYNNDIFGSFLFNTVAGDLFYCAILFGSFYVARLKFPVLAKA